MATGTVMDVVDVARLGKEIKRERDRLGLTQTQLGERMGRDQAVVSTMERGEHGMGIELLDLTARALGLDLATLLVRAGAIDIRVPVKEILASDPELSEEGRRVVVNVYEFTRLRPDRT